MLEYRLGDRDISEVLAMSVTEAEESFGAGEARTPAAHKILVRLADVGLGYLGIGQPLTTRPRDSGDSHARPDLRRLAVPGAEVVSPQVILEEVEDPFVAQALCGRFTVPVAALVRGEAHDLLVACQEVEELP